MNRKPTSPPKKTWEFFSACIYYLGKSTLTSLFQRSERQIERWSADPKTSGTAKNPVDKYETLLEKLVQENHTDIARSVVSRQAHIVGCDLAPKKLPQPDKETLEYELIDDIPAKAEYDRILMDPLSTREACKASLDTIIRELTENYVKRCNNSGWNP